jgi:dTMP kinase
MFITFEGIDGSGKSTQIKLLTDLLNNWGYKVKVLREPGSTEFSEEIRKILLFKHFDIGAVTELMLFDAARSHLAVHEIIPALERGEIVLCDRFYDSTTAYQGYGRGLNLEDVSVVNKIATGGLKPDLTFFLDVSLAISNDRIKYTESDRIEAAGNEFFNKVRNGFLEIARNEPERVIVINSEAKVEETQNKIINILKQKVPGLFKNL